MPLWRVQYDSRAGFYRHALAPGFGHALLAPIVADTFRLLGVSGSVTNGPYWWSIHAAPSLVPFELEHGNEAERFAYNGRRVAEARRTKRNIRGQHAGYIDLFVPIVARGETVAVLVVGPFSEARPSSTDVLHRWRKLTGRQGHPADPEFAAYLSATLATLVLDGGRAAVLEKLLVCLAGLMSGGGDCAGLANEASVLRAQLEPVRLVERTWDAVRTMLDERSPRTWASAHRAVDLAALGLPRLADHVLVGLTVSLTKDVDPVDEAIRRDGLQRAAVELARATGDCIAGQIGDHGVAFLSAASGGALRQNQRLADLADRTASVARRRHGLAVHFGSSPAVGSSPLSRSYQKALGAAESALAQGIRWVAAEASAPVVEPSLRRLRDELGRPEERPDLLAARFDAYLEALAMHGGYRVDAVRGHLDAGFERTALPLVASGALDRRSFRDLCDALDRASSAARTLQDLFAAYRRAVADVSDAVQTPVPARRDRSLRAAVDYVRQHYAEPLSFGKVARVAGFSPAYFSELFRKREGTTFERYVRGLRVERAKQLLAATDLPVARVAGLSGFRSPQYFCEVFRAAAGTAPLGFRRRARVAPGPGTRLKQKRNKT